MANRKLTVISTRELSTEIEGRLVSGDQAIVGSADMKAAVDVTKAGHESAGQDQPDSMTHGLKAQRRPQSAMSIRSGLKESLEASSGGRMSISGMSATIGVILSPFSMTSPFLVLCIVILLVILMGCITVAEIIPCSCAA